MLKQVLRAVVAAALLVGGTLRGAESSELKSGVAVHVCSDSPKPGLDLAATGRWVVHAVCASPELTAKARAAFTEGRVYGLASAEYRADLRSLPYASRIVNTLIMDDWSAAQRRGLTWAECLRIVVPRGSILVGGVGVDQAKAQLAAQGLAVQDAAQDGHRVRVTTAWPAELDKWTHNRYRDAGNQAVSRDPINPATQNLWFQWLDGEQEPQGCHAAMAAITSADGRLISLAGFEVAGLIREGRYWRGGPRQMWMLSCRDAFNGTLQWLRPWNGTHIKKAKRSLAVVGDRIYTVEAGRLTATDARDGRIVWVAPGPEEFHEESWLHCDAKVAVVQDDAAKQLGVFDAATGERLWRGPDGINWPVALDEGRLVAVIGGGDAAATACIAAFDAVTGKELWSKSQGDFGQDGGQIILRAASRGLVLATVPPAHTAVLKGASGEVLYKFEGEGPAYLLSDRIVVQRRMARGEAADFYDLRTGELAGQGTPPHPYSALGMYACAGGAYTEKMFFDRLAATTGPAPARGRSPLPFPYLGSSGTHMTCITGDVVAHGMVYQPQQGCRCPKANGGVRGLYALAPVDAPPPQTAFEDPGPLEPGPALGEMDPAPADANGWPMLRGDAARSCAAKGDAEPTAVIWRQALAARPEGWIVRSTWRAQHHHNQTISAPVVAGGKVFVSLNDQHQVVALEAPSGQVAWRYTANARIDSPPTIHKGLCLFGCRDGWVYCLRAADGRLAWRRRIAPSEQRILVYGQFESRWPVIGTILSDGDRAYANAGHDPAMNILLWEFDPATGKTFGFGPTPRSHFPNDMLVKGDDGGIYLNRVALRGTGPATESPAWRAAIQGYVAPRVGHLNPLDTSIISSADTVSLKPRGGLYLRQIVANRWTWDGARLIGFTSTGYRKGAKNARSGLNYEHLPSPAVFCLDPSKLDAENGAALRWQTPAEDVWAMALASRRVIIAGPRVGRPKPPSPTSQPTAAGLLAALRTAPTAPSPSGTPLPTGIPADRMWDSAILSTMVGQWSWWQQDPLAAPGFVRVLDAADGKVLHSLDLPSAVVQDGIAVSGGRAYVTTADGSVCCLGTAAKPSPASHSLPR